VSEPGETRRSYHSPRREAQAAATRREILDAAGRLFERQGYAATTMAAIAAEAGVSLKTVYVAFATKPRVLQGLWNLRLRGDEEDVPVGERAWYRELLDEPDPERQLRTNAHNSRVGKERFGGVLEVIRGMHGGAAPHVYALVASTNQHGHALFSRHGFGELSATKPGGEAIRIRPPD